MTGVDCPASSFVSVGCYVFVCLYFSEGSTLTPAHHYSDFRFKAYAPIAFRYFRELFGIQPDDFLVRCFFQRQLFSHSTVNLFTSHAT